MARNQTWATIRTAFKAEAGIELDETVATGDNARYLALANNTIKWLIGQNAWLLGKTRADVALTTGTRYYTFPETTIDITQVDTDAFVKQSDGYRYSVCFGIGQGQYNAYGSETEQINPVARWDLVNVSGVTKIEVWPLPQDDTQTLMLSGIGVFTPMTLDASTCPLDDMLVVYFMAAEQLARSKSADAQAKLVKAQAHLAALKGARQSEYETFSMAGGGRPNRNEPLNRPTVN